jgi:hypothetical protein
MDVVVTFVFEFVVAMVSVDPTKLLFPYVTELADPGGA